MNYQRRLRLMFLYTALLLAAVAAINWRVDPLGIWGNGRRPDETLSREVVPYAVALGRPTTLLVGNSRIAWSMYVGARGGLLNAGLPGATLDEMAALVDRAVENPGLRRLLIGADLTLFRPGHRGFAERYDALPRRLRLDPLLLVPETLLNERVLDRSRKALQRRWQTAPPDPTEASGLWSAAHVRSEIERLMARPTPRENPLRREANRRMAAGSYLRFAYARDQLDKLRALIENAERRGVEVLVLVPTQSAAELRALEQEGAWPTLQALRRELAGVHPYYDAAGYNFLAFERRLFIDPLHLWPVVGQVLLRSLLGTGCADCGEVGARIAALPARIDAGNVDAHLAAQERRRARRLEAGAY
jgi:hypothetical protein